MNWRLGLLGVLALTGVGLALTKPHRAKAPAIPDVGAEPDGLEPQPFWDMSDTESGDGRRYEATNRLAGPAQIECALTEATNVVADPALPRRLVLPPFGTREITHITREREGVASAKIRCLGVPGDPHALVDQTETYRLPFYPDAHFTLEQGFDGPFSHHDAQSRYAIDLGVDEGTPVLAARGGTVMQVEEEFRGRGLDIERFGDRANIVRIVHDDGSMAVYAHLAPLSTIVKPGEMVRVGDLLGKSGNTGFSAGPHLHFAVQANRGMRLESVPFVMHDVDPRNPRK